jgi:hypothetical protein
MTKAGGGDMGGFMRFAAVAGAAVSLLIAPAARAEATFKVGLILPMTGPFQSTGWQANAAVGLFLKQRGSAVAGKKIEILLKDDGGVIDASKRIAQELIVLDKVDILLGFGLTPIALAVAPLATEAKIPMNVTVASTSVVVDRSPTKTPQLENAAAVMRRLEEASRLVEMNRLAISPQCGFASVVEGNKVTGADQRAKLELVVDVARQARGVS